MTELATTSALVKTPQLDFKTTTIMGPKYKYVRIPMNNHASASVNIQPTSTELLEWKLPTQVYNLARSYIAYNVHVPAEVDFYQLTFEDTFDIAQSATFGSAGGVDLVNIQHLQNYVKIARKIDTPVEDFMGNSNMSQLYRCNNNGASNKQPFAYTTVGATAVYNGVDNYVEPMYTEYGAKDVSFDRYRQFPLGAISGTLFAVDRDFYSPVEQYLRITAGVGKKIALSTKDTAKPDVLASATKTPPIVSINDCYLYLAIEQNLQVQAYMIDKYRSGQMRYTIPYTTGFKNSGALQAGDTTNIQIQISQQYGKRLKRILHSVWNNKEEGATAYDCSNWDGSKIESYHTFLDSLPIQDRILSCKRPSGTKLNSDDWFENKRYLDKRSCILSKEMYALNWFHIDQWHEPHDKTRSLPDVNIDEGLVMDTPKSWTISAKSTAGGLVHYTWVEFMREIEVTVAGPGFV